MDKAQGNKSKVYEHDHGHEHVHQQRTQKHCPSCGKSMHLDGDICEECGAWTKPGQCYICLTPIDPDMNFCPECGNPANGITCPSCGQLSFSDYCPACHTRLTEQAAELEVALHARPEFVAYFAQVAELTRLGDEINQIDQDPPRDNSQELQSSSEQEVLANLKALADRRRASKGLEQPTPIPKTELKPRNEQLGTSKIQVEIETRRAYLNDLLEKKRQLEAQVKNPPAPPLEFTNAQDVRRFYMAIKPPTYKGWLCNAFSMLHADPIHCECPGDGGRWLSQEEYDAMT